MPSSDASPAPTPSTLEDQVLDLWSSAARASNALDFGWGPAIPFIQFGRFLSLADRIPVAFRGKRGIDFGCGAMRPYSMAALMYLAGADEVLALDVTDIGPAVPIAKGLYAMLATVAIGASGLERHVCFDRKTVLSRVADFDLEALRAGDLAGGLPTGIRHRHGDYLQIAAELGTFDLVVSNSVFEHVPDLAGTMRALRQNLRDGAVVYTDIDYRDHRQYVTGASSWQYLLDDGDHAPGYINKIRHTAMTALLNDCGFRIAEAERVLVDPPESVRSSLHPRHAATSEVDLRTVQDTLLLV